MAINAYKVVIYGQDIYREIDLINVDEIIFGTTKRCRARVNRELFFEDFEIKFTKTNNNWSCTCSDNIYFTIDGIVKLTSKQLSHGEKLIVKYSNSNMEIFSLEFVINFDLVQNSYDRKIDISGVNLINIGNDPNCNIVIGSQLIGKGSLSIIKEKVGYLVRDNNSQYGVYVNGTKIKENKMINDCDFVMISGYSFYIRDNSLYTTNSKSIVINNLKYTDIIPTNKFKYPKFIRNARINYVKPDGEINILDPKAKPTKNETSFLQTIAPALLMIAVTVFLRGSMGGGGSFIIFSIATMGVGIVTSIMTYFTSRKKYKQDIIKRREQYFEYIGKKELEIQEERKNERRILELIYSPIEELVREVRDFSKRLFEKSKEDQDYLVVRLGTGTIRALKQISIKEQEFKETDDELIDIPEELEKKYSMLDEAPVTIDLKNANAIGIIGSKGQLYNVLKNITLDIVVRHFYKEVKLFYIISSEDCEQFKWIRWLRHVENDRVDLRNVMYDKESKNYMLEMLYSELSAREGAKNNTVFDSQYIIFVFDSEGLKKHPVSKYIDKCGKYGFTFIFFESSEELLLKGCTKIIKLNNTSYSGQIIENSNGDNIQEFKFNTVPDTVAEEVALKLSSVYVDEVSLEGSLTKNISLYELLDIYDVDDLDIGKRWANSKVFDSMAAPLGVKSGNEVVCLDLNEKHHGPHGLVAGTTGSGKSEILQSYILSMATIFHPYEVGFVIIDFKGGGMVNQFKDLPHLVGAITNIDGREINRSLKSIKAELRKRQELFAENNVNHIDAYIKLYKEGKTNIPLPHLILIVDEFAELKSDQPEFMKELISAARIGRSLGVHLILATQKPSGVVDDQIWSNSKFKLCLKVQNKNDSNEVLKSPLAAEIKEPGRAYLQVGNNEIFELFQSAYSGAPAQTEDMGNQKEYSLNLVTLSGRKQPIFIQKKSKSKKSSTTQLEAIVEYINDYCNQHKIKHLPGICLPPLKETINYGEINAYDKRDKVFIESIIGIYDDPSQQLQDIVTVNHTQENMIILGSSQYGKTNLLQTIIRDISMNYSPKDVNIYILDFASRILKNFEKLNHVGGVITANDDEKLKNFIKLVNTEIESRKEILSSMGISSFASYRESGFSDIPQIVIIIDNYLAIMELYPQYEDDILKFTREGISCGVSIILATAQMQGIGYKYLSSFSRRIALYCNDSSMYSSVLDRVDRDMYLRSIPGRGLVEIEKNLYEYQTYLAFEGEKEIDRVNNMKEFIASVNDKYREYKAKRIPEIPNVLTDEYLEDNYVIPTEKYVIPIGINYNSIELISIDLLKNNVVSIFGREGSGKTNFVNNIISRLIINKAEAPFKLIVIDNMDKQLQYLSELDETEKYSFNPEDIIEIINDTYTELEERYNLVIDEKTEEMDEKPYILIIVKNMDAIISASEDNKVFEKYKEMISKYKSLKVGFIFGDLGNTNIAYSSPAILKSIKESPHSFIFNDVAEIKSFDIPIAVERNYKKKISVGDAYYFKDIEISKIKTILNNKVNKI